MVDIFVSDQSKNNPPPVGQPEKVVSVVGKQAVLRLLSQFKTVNPLSAFIPLPKHTHFETQEEEEKIILVLRGHWLLNIGWVIQCLILFLLPPIINQFISLNFLPPRFRFMTFLLWYLFLIGFLFERFLDWYFNIFIITDRRVVDLDFYGLTYKEISDTNLNNIQDITYRTVGFTNTLFDYGDVIVQTAAEVPFFEIKNVPHPSRVSQVIRELTPHHGQ